MEIRAFRGWRYACGEEHDFSSFLAPPYDVLSGEDKAALMAAAGGPNIVEVDLPHVPPHDAGPEVVYQDAAALLARWQAECVLCQEAEPAIYVYDQTYTWAGVTSTRRSLIAGLRSTELGKDIIPHEHTFPGPKADRLLLTRHTRTQISPIFGFYNDTAGTVADLLAAATQGPADAHGQLRDVAESLWAVTDAEIISAVASALRDEPAFIADGHHRYGTAMNYRDALRAE